MTELSLREGLFVVAIPPVLHASTHVHQCLNSSVAYHL